MKCTVTLIAMVVLTAVSSKVFSQDTEKSSHPLLDKYYPQAKQPANSNLPQTKKTTSLSPATQTQAPVSNTPVSNNAPTLPVNTTDPGPEPGTTATHSISTDSSVTKTPTTTTITTIVNRPAVITNTAPVQQTQTRSYDPNSIYDTRLGSSSPQYNTYEKNSYGAGTVTISPK